jgi:hypothetical protein
MGKSSAEWSGGRHSPCRYPAVSYAPRHEVSPKPESRVTAAAQPVSRVLRFVSGSLNVILFSIGLLGFGALQTWDLNVPDSDTLGRKWRHCEEHGGRYSLLFVGSSRVAHHFIPEQFDAALKDAGIEMKSFNFGQNGMFPPESFYVTRKVLEKTAIGPRWVLIDLMSYRPILEGNEEAERAIAWHDLRHTILACRMLLSSDYTKPKTDPGLLYHVRLWALRTLGEGRGQMWLKPLLKLKVPSQPGQVVAAGYEPLERTTLDAKETDRFNQLVEALIGTRKSADLPATYRRELDSLIAFVRSRGAEPVFVLAPDIYATQRFNNWPPPGVAQFSYDHPETYPTLYRSDQRFDPSHLDKEGAKEFTRIFAGEFGEWLKRKK